MRLNNYPSSFSKVIRRRSDNLSNTISPPTQNVSFFVTIRLKTNNTVDSVFTNADFLRGASNSSADNVRVVNPKNSSVSIYHVRTSDGTWRDALNSNAANFVIQNNSIISILRRGATLKTYTLKDTARATTYTPF